MFRFAPALRSSLRAAPRVAVAPRVSASSVLGATRAYAASSGLSAQEIQNRIHEVLKSFEKVDVAKVSPTASFTGDLGLDSLDAVEVVMAIEEEFSIEIPDAEADNITTVQQAVEYISNSAEAH